MTQLTIPYSTYNDDKMRDPFDVFEWSPQPDLDIQLKSLAMNGKTLDILYKSQDKTLSVYVDTSDLNSLNNTSPTFLLTLDVPCFHVIGDDCTFYGCTNGCDNFRIS